MPFSPFERAKQHPIRCEKPAVNFFSGALLGNGGMGVVVTTRPDSLLIHFGHNNIWDIRVAEKHQDEIGTFAEIFAKVRAISPNLAAMEEDPWYNDYLTMTQENYRALYPRPFPCGSLLLGFDRRQVELTGHRLDISCGLCEVYFKTLAPESDLVLQIFTEMDRDRLWMRMVDAQGQPVPAPFDRIRLLPDPSSPADIPPFQTATDLPASQVGFSQILPYHSPDQPESQSAHPKDRAFRICAGVNSIVGAWQPQTSYGVPRPADPLERSLRGGPNFLACVQLDEGLASQLAAQPQGLPELLPQEWTTAVKRASASWEAYWNRSGVLLADELLEQVWYWNLYFFNCAVKPEATCPGLFANWSFRDIGTAWHGDYHMNYNTQQPFWLSFSSNHVDKHLAYVNLVDHLMPISRKWASQYYGLRGANFPHSAYPVEMHTMPYPVPHWGWEVCETPWTVQSLWWHYLYTQDLDYLRTRAFVPIQAAVQFLVDYMLRPDAQWDGLSHIFPTVSPELYGLTPGLTKNFDCLVDLTLTKFVFRAYLEAVTVLGLEAPESELCAQVRGLLERFPAYPLAETPTGKVFVSVPGEDPTIVYNVPTSTMTVFPGEDHGLHSPPAEFELAANSYRQQRNEGGNDLVFLNLQGARLGLLDLDRFRRQVNYCLLPNGICQDMVLQVHGRYADQTPYDFMREMGIWFENLALPVVINECLLQSYTGTLRLFPNWPLDRPAEFHTLRAVGGFLVSARCSAGGVDWVHILSETGAPLRLYSPWEPGILIERATLPGEIITLTRPLPTV